MLDDLMINISKLYELFDSTDFLQYNILDILSVISENKGKFLLDGVVWDLTK